jgi:glycine/D-amino acid oxidase-like deaminating enzyme
MLASSSALEAPELVQSVLSEEGIDCDYEQPGHLALAETPSVWEHFGREVERRPANLPHLTLLDRQACEELIHLRLARSFLGGRWYPGARVIHPCKLVYGLAQAATKRGARILTGATVVSIAPQPRTGSLLLHTSRGPLTADQVVLACSSAVGRLLPHYSRIIAPVRGQVLATAPIKARFAPAMGVDFGTVYWRQLPDGRVILGGYRKLGGADEQTRSQRTTSRIQEALAAFLPRAFPGLGPVQVSQKWAGIMDCTPDSRPVVGRDPHLPSCWIIAGFGGHGLPGGLGAARALVEAIHGFDASDQLQPYRPDRFRSLLPSFSIKNSAHRHSSGTS